eukprot:3093471-Ditylum_brightwellii.AAC.1
MNGNISSVYTGDLESHDLLDQNSANNISINSEEVANFADTISFYDNDTNNFTYGDDVEEHLR